jgi:hypothetical protein
LNLSKACGETRRSLAFVSRSTWIIETHKNGFNTQDTVCVHKNASKRCLTYRPVTAKTAQEVNKEDLWLIAPHLFL